MIKATVKLIAFFVLLFGLVYLAWNQGSPSALAADSPADAIVGVWGSENVFGPKVRGELTIDARQPQWRAKIAGSDAAIQRDGHALTFALSGGAGEFRGHVSADGKKVTGDWIQPSGVANDNRYATPVHFVELHSGIWTGQVIPVEDRVSFYISIQRSADGSLTGFIRNPEFNYFRRQTYRIELSGETITLTNAQNSSDRIIGNYDIKSDRLSLPTLNSHPPLEFTRRKGLDAKGFYPRIPAEVAYTYHKPEAGDDGWTTASLAEAGLSEAPLKALVEKILSANLQDNPANIHSLLIARHGKLVFEEYFYGFDRERAHDTRSASKTYGPVLAGIARDHGVKIGPETLVYPLFPRYEPFANWDARKNRLTLRDLMTMTSGLACDDNDDSSPGQEDNMQDQKSQPDWYKYTLDLPMVHDPGGDHAIYCSAGMNLTGGVVKNTTGAWLPEYFEEYLARPLQFHTYHMNLTPTGDAYMGGGLSIRPRDEIKLGQLYLSGGLWNSHRIISNAWVEESTTPHSKFAPMMDIDIDHQYGYGWHISPLKVGDHTYRSFAAGGNGGQIVMVIPELDMVICFNGGSYGEFTKWYRWSLELVPHYIIPAATAAANGKN